MELNLGRVKGTYFYTGSADSDVAISEQLEGAGKVALADDLYLTTTNGNLYKYATTGRSLSWQLVGNLKGNKGDAFQINKVYNSITEMNANYANDNVPIGGFVVIETGNVEDEDNAKIYVKGQSNYEYLTDLSGSKGIQGPASVFNPEISTSTGQAGSAATASLIGSGTTENPFKFVISIPKGDTGSKGNSGDNGYTFTPSVDTSGNLSWTKTQGAGGSVPPTVNIKGPQGERGATPSLSINENGELIATFE